MSDIIMVGAGQTVGVLASAEDRVCFEVVVHPPQDAAPVTPPPEQVRAYSQLDPRYADEIYAGGTTFRSAGCLVCCVAMIASIVYEDEATTYPPEVARRLRDAGAFAGALLSHPSRIEDAYPQLQWGGAAHWRSTPARLDLLADEVERYGATVCELLFNPDWKLVSDGVWNQHFVVVEAVDVDGDDAVIVDSFTGQRGLLSQSPYAEPRGWSASRALYGMRMVRAERE